MDYAASSPMSPPGRAGRLTEFSATLPSRRPATHALPGEEALLEILLEQLRVAVEIVEEAEPAGAHHHVEVTEPANDVRRGDLVGGVVAVPRPAVDLGRDEQPDPVVVA